MAVGTGQLSTKMELQDKVAMAIRHSGSVSEFIQNLEKQNIHFNQASTGRVSGISYAYGDFLIKGQKLGRQFTWGNIIKQIDYEQTRDRKKISQANDRARRIRDAQKGIADRSTNTAGRRSEVGTRRSQSAVHGEIEVIQKQLGRIRKHNRESTDSASGNLGSEKTDTAIQESQEQWQLGPENGVFRTDHRGGNKFGDVGGILDELGTREEEPINKRKARRKKGVKG